MSEDYYFARLVTIGLLLAALTLAVSLAAYDIRSNTLQRDMAAKGYCWERQETSATETWQPCRRKPTVEVPK